MPSLRVPRAVSDAVAATIFTKSGFHLGLYSSQLAPWSVRSLFGEFQVWVTSDDGDALTLHVRRDHEEPRKVQRGETREATRCTVAIVDGLFAALGSSITDEYNEVRGGDVEAALQERGVTKDDLTLLIGGLNAKRRFVPRRSEIRYSNDVE